MKVAWFSAGITSAIACKMALELYTDVELYYIKINSAHSDNERFINDCEKWYGQKIHIIQSQKYLDQHEVARAVKYINGVNGAPCTLKLKKEVRFELEELHKLDLFNQNTITNQVWGFEFDRAQINRAIRFGQQYPATNPLFPLIEKGLDKNQCAGLLLNAGIQLPIMYKLGYSNNNCIGCVKGGKGYWNKIRKDFPSEFKKMVETEEIVGNSCIKDTFLKDLKPQIGRPPKEIMPNCGLLCELEFEDMPDKNLENVLNGSKTIYDAIAA